MMYGCVNGHQTEEPLGPYCKRCGATLFELPRVYECEGTGAHRVFSKDEVDLDCTDCPKCGSMLIRLSPEEAARPPGTGNPNFDRKHENDRKVDEILGF